MRSREKHCRTSARAWPAAALLAVLAALAMPGCASSARVAAGTVSRAGFQTTRGGGFRVSFSISGSVGPQSFATSVTGSLTEPSRRGSLTVTLAGKTIAEVIAYPDVYIRRPASTGATALAPTPWLKLNANSLLQGFGAGASPASGDPSQVLDFLRASAQVMRVGAEPVRGVSTTHYRALADLKRYAALAPASTRADAQRYVARLTRWTGRSTLPVDVWVDSSQRVRRLRLTLSACTRIGRLNEQVTGEFYDFGPQPAVAVPAAREVTDVSGQVSSRIAQAMAQLGIGC